MNILPMVENRKKRKEKTGSFWIFLTGKCRFTGKTGEADIVSGIGSAMPLWKGLCLK
jgi:hypothetical protein